MLGDNAGDLRGFLYLTLTSLSHCKEWIKAVCALGEFEKLQRTGL